MSEEVLGFRIEVKGTDQQTAEMQKLSGEIDSMKKRMVELNKQKKTEEGLTAAQRKEWVLLNTQLKASQTQYNQVNKAILTNNGVLKQSNGLFSGFKQAIGSSIVSMVGWTAAIGAVIGAVGSAIKTVRDFDESVANLQKVTGLAKGEARDLAKEIIKIDTRTSVTALLELATAGGRLGLSGQELIGFTRAADMAFVALRGSLEGNAEEIATTLGKLGDSFGLEKKYGIEGSLTRIGSVLNDLGAKTKAQEGPIVDFTARLAGVASQAGITLPEIAALGALFDANGQSIEIAATTFQKLLPDMGENVEQFAKVAGMDVEEFSALLRDKPFEALKAVAKGAESTEGGLVGLSETLKNYGVDSARAASIVSLLSSKQEDLASMVGIANTALEENSSIQKENAIKQETAGAKIEKLSKNWDEFIIGIEDGSGSLSQSFGFIIDGLDTVLGAFTALTEKDVMKSLSTRAFEFGESIGMITDKTKLFLDAQNQNATLTGALTRKFQDNIITFDQYQAGLKKIADGYVALTAEQNKAAQEEEALAKLKAKNAEADLIAADAAKAKADLDAENAKNAKAQREKDQKEREAENKKAIADRIKAEKEGNVFLLKEQAEFGLTKRQLEEQSLRNEFDSKILAITGQSASEIQLRKDLEAQKKLALDEQKLGFEVADKEINDAKVLEERQLELDNALLLAGEDLAAKKLVLEQQRQLELSQKDLTKAQIDAINIKYDAKEKADAIAALESKKALMDAEKNAKIESLNLMSDALALAASISKKDSTQQRTLASASALISTYLAAQQAYASQFLPIPTVSSPVRGAFAASIAVASGLANVARINGVQFADGGLVQGASHEQGGVQMFHKSGQHIGEMEGEEYIFSKKRVKEIGVSNLDAMNFGGVTPDVGRYFADGGLVPNTNGMSTSTNGVGQLFNMEEMAALMTMKMQETILRTEIVNNATDTYGVAANVINTKNSLSFG